MRNAIRWMLGTLAHDEGEEISYCTLPDLEKFILHRLFELDHLVNRAYDEFDFKKLCVHCWIFRLLSYQHFILISAKILFIAMHLHQKT